MTYYDNWHKVNTVIADYYRLLGVSRSASKAEIKKAHMKLVTKFHPDKCPDKVVAQGVTAHANAAKDVLLDVVQKDHYDEALKAYKVHLDNFEFYPDSPKHKGKCDPIIKEVSLHDKATKLLSDYKYSLPELVDKITNNDLLEVLRVLLQNKQQPETALKFTAKIDSAPFLALKAGLTVDKAMQFKTEIQTQALKLLQNSSKNFAQDAQIKFALLVSDAGKLEAIKLVLQNGQDPADVAKFVGQVHGVELKVLGAGFSVTQAIQFKLLKQFDALKELKTYSKKYDADAQVKYALLVKDDGKMEALKFVLKKGQNPEDVSKFSGKVGGVELKVLADGFTVSQAMKITNQFQYDAYVKLKNMTEVKTIQLKLAELIDSNPSKNIFDQSVGQGLDVVKLQAKFIDMHARQDGCRGADAGAIKNFASLDGLELLKNAGIATKFACESAAGFVNDYAVEAMRVLFNGQSNQFVGVMSNAEKIKLAQAITLKGTLEILDSAMHEGADPQITTQFAEGANKYAYYAHVAGLGFADASEVNSLKELNCIKNYFAGTQGAFTNCLHLDDVNADQ